MQNSVYWWSPEKFNIFFHGNKEEIYKKYYFGVPSRLWYSTDPYIDRGVRADRFDRLMKGLSAANIFIGLDVLDNFKDLMAGSGHNDYREMSLDPHVALDLGETEMPKMAVPTLAGRPIEKRLHLRYEDSVLSFDYDPQLLDIMGKVGAQFWTSAA
jgi:hypothetical protein